MVTCLSPNGSTTLASAAMPDVLVVATLDGLVTARRGASQWVADAPQLVGQHFASLHYEATGRVIYACSYEGALYRSVDLGRSWEAIAVDLGGLKAFSITSVEREDGVVLYLGTEPVHLWCSSDGGASWRELPAITAMPGAERWTFPAPPHEAHLKNLTFDPDRPNAFFASIEQGGLFRTEDGGEHFVELESVVQADDLAYKDIHRVVLHPARPERLFITGGDGVSRSDDGGTTWRRLLGRDFAIGYPDGLVIDPRDPDLVFLSGAIGRPGLWRERHRADARVARSRDGGEHWELCPGLAAPLHGNIEAMSLSVSPQESALYLATTDGEVFESRDGGDRFELVVSGLEPISKGGHYRNIAVAP